MQENATWQRTLSRSFQQLVVERSKGKMIESLIKSLLKCG